MLSTLHARLGLSQAFTLDTLARCLTCKTPQATSKNNRPLALLGQSLLQHQISRHILRKHPRLPQAVVRATERSYIGSRSLAPLSQGWGVEVGSPTEAQSQGKLIFARHTEDKDMAGIYTSDAHTAVVRAIIGGIALHDGEEAARAFIQKHILSRSLPIEQTFKLTEPQRSLSLLCEREGLPAPINRLIAETGRKTNSPVFVVGVYSGSDKLGEGQGASLREAEYLAQTAALKGWMMFEDPRHAGDTSVLIDSGDIFA
ncbi:hypothetical protein BCR37DRAFT_353881 [Protomyces lactucae-debilis]|uniref:Large ribosomal subunit protein mL44 n=1 Tax=Protomyces lactucae-debilis TaxID=2754530 RepID=A0A1Y2FRZ7_PROLT|nr:uncharacterized protein BCR37DRAFT_353881 [Protomyces lactucae-debilis]ORY86763.1 hypothetical protein BCR37DRAFT_353881 [Protomyces lactucae-debilis]